MKFQVILISIIMLGCSENRSSKASVARATEAQFEKGKQLYNQHCVSCHSGPTSNVSNSLFSDIFQRLPAPGEAYFLHFVQDSKKLKTAGDEYAVSLDSAYDSADYEHFFGQVFTKQDFDNLILYIKTAQSR